MCPGTMNNNQEWEMPVSLQILYNELLFEFQEQNFNIFTGYDDEPIISFDPSSTVHENGSVWQTCDHEIDFCGVELLSALWQQVRDFRSMVYSYSAWDEFQLFLGANSILYGKY